MEKNKIFKIEVMSAYAEWWRYNVFVTAACFDAEGKVADYLTLTDKVYEPGDGTEIRNAPESYDPVRPLVLETSPCDHAEIYVYVIANTFPSSASIKDSPPFDVEVAISRDGGKPETTLWKVNQWGGVSIKQAVR